MGQGKRAVEEQDAPEEVFILTPGAEEAVRPDGAIPEAFVAALAELLLADLQRIRGERAASAAASAAGSLVDTSAGTSGPCGMTSPRNDSESGR